MNARIQALTVVAAGLFLVLIGPPVRAQVLTFEGLQDVEPVADFYNGGTGAFGSGPGPNYGITFSDNAAGLIDSDDGGIGNFGGEPSSDTVLLFLTGPSYFMNVSAGFTTTFSLFYSSPLVAGTVTIFSGLDGT